MKEEITEQDVKEFLTDIVNKVNDELDKDLEDLHELMMVLEFRLVATFNQKQEKLYKDFCEARDKYYDLAKQLYERKRPKSK